MCWNVAATATMVVAGAAATALSIRRGDRAAIPFTLAYFTAMEVLQLAGYAVIDQCGAPANQTVTLLSILHIAFQPVVINAFALELVPAPIRIRARWPVLGLAALASLVILLQLYLFDWAGTCRPGDTLCGERLCTVTGSWHLAWEVPFNGLLLPVEDWFGTHWGFPSYMLAVFALPLAYGAWRFALFHLAVGPLLAGQLSSSPNEIPAIWCLTSIGMLLVVLSPALRQRLSWQARLA